MPNRTVPRAPRLLRALGLGLISAALTAGAVLGGMLVLRPAEAGEDFAGMFALLLAPPAQLVVGTWLAWYVLDDSSPRPTRAWGMSTGLGLALVAAVMLPLGVAGLHAAWRTLGLALLGLLLGGVVPALASRNRQQDLLTQNPR